MCIPSQDLKQYVLGDKSAATIFLTSESAFGAGIEYIQEATGEEAMRVQFSPDVPRKTEIYPDKDQVKGDCYIVQIVLDSPRKWTCAIRQIKGDEEENEKNKQWLYLSEGG